MVDGSGFSLAWHATFRVLSIGVIQACLTVLFKPLNEVFLLIRQVGGLVLELVHTIVGCPRTFEVA